MPFFQETISVFFHQSLDMIQFRPAESAAVLKANRLKPEFGCFVIPFDMNMSRLGAVP
jgi:hypothetical protein